MMEEENNKVINVIIRAVDTDETQWVMGEDLHFEISQGLTIREVAEKIKEEKSKVGLAVSVSRMVMYVVPSSQPIPATK